MTNEPFPVLVSYAYLRKLPDKCIKWLFTRPELRMLLDSGAFTAFNTGNPIHIQEYIDFLLKWKKIIPRFAALDVIGEPVATRKNLFAMLKAGLKPMPVFVTGEKKDWLEELYKHSDVVALPLSVPVSKSMAIRRKFMQVRMRWAAGRKVHWFGFTEQRSLEKWKPYSCDSSSWLAPARYGMTRIYLGRGEWLPTFNHKQYMTKMKTRMRANKVFKTLGYNTDHLNDTDYWSRNIRKGIAASQHVSYQATIESAVRHSREIKSRFKSWFYLSVVPSTGTAGDMYWLHQHINNVNVAAIEKQPKLVGWEGASHAHGSTGVGRNGQRSSAVPSLKGSKSKSQRTGGGLRPTPSKGTGFSKINLF